MAVSYQNLFTWFIAIEQIISAKKGMSSLQLSRSLEVNKNTAWYIQNKSGMRHKVPVLGLIESETGKVSLEVKFTKRYNVL